MDVSTFGIRFSVFHVAISFSILWGAGRSGRRAVRRGRQTHHMIHVSIVKTRIYSTAPRIPPGRCVATMTVCVWCCVCSPLMSLNAVWIHSTLQTSLVLDESEPAVWTHSVCPGPRGSWGGPRGSWGGPWGGLGGVWKMNEICKIVKIRWKYV